MRSLTGAMLAAIEADEVRPAVLVEAAFRSGVVRFWSGLGKITWRNVEWNGSTPGAAAVLSIDPIEEVAGVEATGLRAKLTGLDAMLLGRVREEIRIGKKCRVWFGLMDAAGTLIDAPYVSFDGFLDASSDEESGSTAEITLSAESELRRLQVPRLRRLTLADHQTDFPGDTFLKFVAAQPNWKGTWGGTRIGSGAGGSTTGREGHNTDDRGPRDIFN